MNPAVSPPLNLLERAEQPLVIIGKGMAWARAEDAVRAFIQRTQATENAATIKAQQDDDSAPTQ